LIIKAPDLRTPSYLAGVRIETCLGVEAIEIVEEPHSAFISLTIVNPLELLDGPKS